MQPGTEPSSRVIQTLTESLVSLLGGLDSLSVCLYKPLFVGIRLLVMIIEFLIGVNARDSWRIRPSRATLRFLFGWKIFLRAAVGFWHTLVWWKGLSQKKYYNRPRMTYAQGTLVPVSRNTAKSFERQSLRRCKTANMGSNRKLFSQINII